MPTNLKSFRMHLQTLMCRRLTDYYFPEGGVVFLPGSPKTRKAVGIHMLAPETYEIESAVSRAARDGFETIYLYTEAEKHVS